MDKIFSSFIFLSGKKAFIALVDQGWCDLYQQCETPTKTFLWHKKGVHLRSKWRFFFCGNKSVDLRSKWSRLRRVGSGTGVTSNTCGKVETAAGAACLACLACPAATLAFLSSLECTKAIIAIPPSFGILSDPYGIVVLLKEYLQPMDKWIWEYALPERTTSPSCHPWNVLPIIASKYSSLYYWSQSHRCLANADLHHGQGIWEYDPWHVLAIINTTASKYSTFVLIYWSHMELE